MRLEEGLSALELLIEAWNYAAFPRYFANNIFLSFSEMALVLLTSVLAAYAFARIDLFGKNAIFLGHHDDPL